MRVFFFSSCEKAASLRIITFLHLSVADNQKSSPLKQNHLISIANPTKIRQMTFQHSNVWNKICHDLTPCLIQRLIPNTRPKALEVLHPHAQTALLDQSLPILQNQFSLLLRNQIHLVHQHEYPRIGRILLHRLQHAREVIEVLLGTIALDIKNVNQQLHAAKNGLAIALEVALVESILAAAIPEVQDEVAEETDVMVLHVEGGREAHGVSSEVVGEYDGTHGGFARVGLTHEEDFLLGHGDY
mmetsp:Transcript_16030/g.28915  ORF Transcript_16030/g.28915 Transcript_16030/m.28915 type:complete len:243 (-) Transcript_16030:108-836(-)